MALVRALDVAADLLQLFQIRKKRAPRAALSFVQRVVCGTLALREAHLCLTPALRERIEREQAAHHCGELPVRFASSSWDVECQGGRPLVNREWLQGPQVAGGVAAHRTARVDHEVVAEGGVLGAARRERLCPHSTLWREVAEEQLPDERADALPVGHASTCEPACGPADGVRQRR
jgi:hypothetical protein